MRPESDEWSFPNQATPLGSAAYYAVRFSPGPMRHRTALLFAWYQLIQQIAEHPRDPGAARLKLDWWCQEAENIARAQARHPLAKELQSTGLDQAAVTIMTAIIDTADQEIRTASLKDVDEFSTACRDSLGHLFSLLTRLEHGSGHPADGCLELGGYCAAVERIRRLAECPQRVPDALNPQRLGKLDRARRTELIETLLGRFQHKGKAGSGQISDFARRMTALSRAMHSKMRSQGYPVMETLIDRAPIAHLWTAWRCR